MVWRKWSESCKSLLTGNIEENESPKAGHAEVQQRGPVEKNLQKLRQPDSKKGH